MEQLLDFTNSLDGTEMFDQTANNNTGINVNIQQVVKAPTLKLILTETMSEHNKPFFICDSLAQHCPKNYLHFLVGRRARKEVVCKYFQ